MRRQSANQLSNERVGFVERRECHRLRRIPEHFHRIGWPRRGGLDRLRPSSPQIEKRRDHDQNGGRQERQRRERSRTAGSRAARVALDRLDEMDIARLIQHDHRATPHSQRWISARMRLRFKLSALRLAFRLAQGMALRLALSGQARCAYPALSGSGRPELAAGQSKGNLLGSPIMTMDASMWSRRHFLGSLAAGLSVPAGARAWRAPQDEIRTALNGPVGLQMWSLREYLPKDLAGTLAKIRAMGFREVEGAGPLEAHRRRAPRRARRCRAPVPVGPHVVRTAS